MNRQTILRKFQQWFSRQQPSRRIYFDHTETDIDDITTYGTTNEIFTSGRFSADERRREYRRRGKSPSGVIDGIYNDMFRENDMYNDDLRDWEADA
jgi:hypothetical protein